MDSMRVTIETVGGARALPPGVVVVQVAGEVGITAMVGEDGKHTGVGEDNALSKALAAALEMGPEIVVVDLGGATYLSSIGMGALLRFANRLGDIGAKLRLAAVPPMVHSLLQRCRLDTAFDIRGTVAEAVAA
ncbi:MAG TPA: STAS domain-containing protein [Tepidisphaeraceae bacterium]|nr:STAS domain-containing protein [Tepidisphaeraceae bacterium]